MQRTSNSIYGGLGLALLGFTGGCARPGGVAVDTAPASTTFESSSTPEQSCAIAAVPRHQAIVDNLARAERLLERFEEHAVRFPVDGAKFGSKEIAPELSRIGDALLVALIDPQCQLSAAQSTALKDTVKSLKVVESLLRTEQIRPTVFFSNVRGEEKNITACFEAKAELAIAKGFFTGGLLIESLAE